MGYQSFGSEIGDSKSTLKLEALALPERLDGESVLDVGCNEGFFCAEVVRRGAQRVVGIDSNESVIRSASQRTSEADFRCRDWWDLPDEHFDWILFTSAIHYERNPKELLTQIRSRLKPGGTLVLECGVFQNDRSKTWHVVERTDGGILQYPSWGMLLHSLLDGYAVRDIGVSVMQSGDPVPRYVFHCTDLRKVVIFVSGNSGTGKTILGRELAKQGLRVVQLDDEYSRFVSANTDESHGAVNFFKTLFFDSLPNNQRGGVDTFLHKVVAMKEEDRFTRLVAELIGTDQAVTLLEGYHLQIPSLRKSLKRYLESKSFRVYELDLNT